MAEALDNDEEMFSSPVPSPNALEPTEVEHDAIANEDASPPGSLPLITEHGNPRFPRDLLVGGGFEVLGNPMNMGLPDWITSQTALELHVSIEAVLLNMVHHALLNRDANWPGLLLRYSWFPRALLEVSQSKRKACWDWIMSKQPEEPALPGDVIQPHVFWVKGYGLDKAKDDKLIEMNSTKALNYLGFRSIIRQVANDCITSQPGPVEIGALSRCHWNNLREPSVSDLKTRVQKKKKKNRSKILAAKKQAKKSSSGPSNTTSEPQEGQDQAADPSPARGLDQPDDEEVVMLGEVRNTTGQPNVAPGIAPLPPGVPIIRTPQVNFNQANPSQLGGNPGAAQLRFQYPAAPRYDRGKQRVYGRQRGGGYRGRKNVRSFSSGPRGGGNTNFRAQGVATNSQLWVRVWLLLGQLLVMQHSQPKPEPGVFPLL